MIIDKYNYLLDRRRALLIAKLTFIEGSNRPTRPWQFARKSDILIPISPCVTRSIDDLSDGTFFTMPLISPPPPQPFPLPPPRSQSIRPRFNIFGWISRSGWLGSRASQCSHELITRARAIVSLRWYSRPDKFVSETTDCAPPRRRFYNESLPRCCPDYRMGPMTMTNVSTLFHPEALLSVHRGNRKRCHREQVTVNSDRLRSIQVVRNCFGFPRADPSNQQARVYVQTDFWMARSNLNWSRSPSNQINAN